MRRTVLILAWAGMLGTMTWARADYGLGESAQFELNLLTTPLGGTVRAAESASFGFDLRWVQRAYADSAAFIADTNLGDVLIYAAQSYRPASSELVMAAVANDTHTGRVTAGTFTWSLRDSAHAEIASGNLTYDTVSQAWLATATVPALGTGSYTLLYSISTSALRTASRLMPLAVGGGVATVNGVISDGASGVVLQNVQVALFGAGPFWDVVQANHGGVIPPIATLAAEIGTVRGPVATDTGGAYAWTDVPVGGPYVVVAERSGYLQGYSPSFAIEAGIGTIGCDIAMYPDSVRTLAAMTADAMAVYGAAGAVLEYNAQVAGSLSQRWHADDIYTYNLDWFSLLGTTVGATAGGISGLADGVLQTTSDKVLYVGAHVIAELSKTAVSETVEYIRVLVTQNVFPADKAGYLASAMHQPYQTRLDAAIQDFVSQAPALPLADGFSVDRSRKLKNQIVRELGKVTSGQYTYLASPQAAKGVYGFSLKNMAQGYEHLSDQHRDLKITKNVLSGVQIVGGSIVILGASAAGPTLGISAAVAGVAAVATTAAGYGKTAVTLADLAVKSDMALNFGTAICGTYPQDNDKAVRVLEEYAGLLQAEAASPFYLNGQNQFASSLTVDMNFPGDEPILWTLGLFGYDTAHNTATVIMQDTSTIGAGSRPLDVRCVGYGVWSPVAFIDSPEVLVVSSEVRGPSSLPVGGSVQFSLPYRGFARGFLSQFKPHYLQVNAYVGPWLVGNRYEPFFVLAPGEWLTPLLPAASMTETREPVAAAVNLSGPLAAKDVIAMSEGTQSLGDLLLSAAAPVQTVPITIAEQLHAADIRVFAPSEAGVSVVVTDAGGSRLGFSTEEGVLVQELIGNVSAMGERPISLRLLNPPIGANYTLQVTLLTPGEDSVPVSVFLEPVRPSGAIMAAFPSAVLLDGDRDTTQSPILRLGEISGQSALTTVQATFGILQKSDDPSAALTPSFSTEYVGDIPADEQRMLSWDVPYLPTTARGKYVGSITCVSQETAPLTIPVVALVRNSQEVVSLFEGTSGEDAQLQVALTAGPDGVADSWVRIPPGYQVLHAILGLAPASTSLIDPSLDIGGDGQAEWSFTGTLDSAVMIRDLEGGFNQYIREHTDGSGHIDVPIRLILPANGSAVLNGIQLFLENDIVGDFDLDRDVDLSDLHVLEDCASGPGVPHDGSATCKEADLDADNDIDQVDFSIMQRCFSGADVPADPNCAN